MSKIELRLREATEEERVKNPFQQYIVSRNGPNSGGDRPLILEYKESDKLLVFNKWVAVPVVKDEE